MENAIIKSASFNNISGIRVQVDLCQELTVWVSAGANLVEVSLDKEGKFTLVDEESGQHMDYRPRELGYTVTLEDQAGNNVRPCRLLGWDPVAKKNWAFDIPKEVPPLYRRTAHSGGHFWELDLITPDEVNQEEDQWFLSRQGPFLLRNILELNQDPLGKELGVA